ncbi:MAG: hypothetical protein LQ340_003488 [Diploschistes diacapsis]|nr:MAG: hypothetical protein LQ340_003488 [Diploschistes diacapsis]
MTWWSSSKPADPKPSSDRGFEAPNRSDRARCWAARDAFFACLDRHGIVDSLKDSDSADRSCGTEEKLLQRDCASSWVTYFKQRRVMEHKKKAMLQNLKDEGAQEVPGGLPGSMAGAAPASRFAK